MSNWLQSAENAVKGAFCQYLGAVDNYLGFWSELGVPTDRISPPLREYVCDEPGPDLPPPPFTGGQCDGVSYIVRVFTQQPFPPNETTLNSSQTVTGPVTSVRITSRSPRPGFEGQVDDITYVISSASPLITRNTGVPTGAGLANVTTERVDGLPDDCGDPDPFVEPLPPGGVTQPINFTYIDASDNSVNVNADLTIFAPVFAPVGVFAPKIFVPIRINGPNFNFNGDIQLPDLNVEIYPSFGRPSGGSPGTDVPDEPDTPDTPTTPEDGDRKILVGMLVRSQPVGRTSTTELLQPTGPNLYVPRLANAYFRIRMGRGLSWIGPIDVKTRDSFIPVPPDVVALTGRVDEEPGWASTVTLVFRTSTPELPE